MEDTNSSKKPTPPYVAFKTFRNFLEKFRQGPLPSRINRDVMGTMSGAAQSQILTTLKYMGLTSDNGIPTDLMRRLGKTEGSEWQIALKDALFASYPYIFCDTFDFSATTVSDLRAQFDENTGASGATIDRCITFLKDAAAAAGIQVSPYLKHNKTRNGGPRQKRAVQQRREKPAEEKVTDNPPLDGERTFVRTPAEAQNSLLLWGLFQRLPKPGVVWPRAQRDQWVQTLQNVFSLEYREE
jgi:hypothetical protein